MKAAKLTLLLLLVLFCSCAVPTYQSKINYNEIEKDFKVTVVSDFERCKKIGVKAMDNEKVIFEQWERGGGKEITFFIKDNVLKEGENLLKFYCDEKEYPQVLKIKNSRFPLMNAVYTDSENSYRIALNSRELFKDNKFFEEFRSYLLYDKKNYDKAKEMINLLPSYYKVQLLSEIADRFTDEIILRGMTPQIQALLFEEGTEDLILKLYNKGNKDIDNDLTYIILSKPVKRYFDKFFPVMLTKPDIYPIIEEHLKTKADTEFSRLVFDYIKENAERGNLDAFVSSYLSLLLEKQPSMTNYVKTLLTSNDPKKEALALKIYKDYGIDEESGQFIMNNWDKLSESVRKDLVHDMMKKFGTNVMFFKRFVKTDDSELKKIMCQVGLNIPSRYEDKDIIDFYLSVNNRDDVYVYFLNANNDLKFNGLRKFYEMEPDNIATLLDIGKSNPKYFAEKLIENFLLKGDSRHKIIAAGHLSEYKEEYLPVLIKAYETEKEPETRQSILASIASAGQKGNVYAYEKVKSEPNLHTREEIYRRIARYAEGEVLNDILSKLKEFPDEIFKPISVGFEESRKSFNCEPLKDIYRRKDDKDVRFRVIWTWAYCCPDSYFAFFRELANEMNDETFLEAIDGVSDIINDVKPSLKEKGFSFLKEIYNLRKTKAVREKIFEVILNAGTANEYGFLSSIANDAVDESEKNSFAEKIKTFKDTRHIKEN